MNVAMFNICAILSAHKCRRRRRRRCRQWATLKRLQPPKHVHTLYTHLRIHAWVLTRTHTHHQPKQEKPKIIFSSSSEKKK